MKKTIITTILTVVASLGCAQDVTIPEQALPNLVQLDVKPALPKIEEKGSLNKSFGYIRMGVSDSKVPDQLDQIVPGIGLGYRMSSGASALDLSAAYNYRTYRTAISKQHTFRYTAPKANYLYYITPARDHSAYAGGGLAWGGLRTQDEREFHGMIPNLAVGYEMNRNATVRTFVQFDISQPAVATSQKGGLPGPFAELSVGAGF